MAHRFRLADGLSYCLEARLAVDDVDVHSRFGLVDFQALKIVPSLSLRAHLVRNAVDTSVAYSLKT